jgi:hypothetical protein
VASSEMKAKRVYVLWKFSLSSTPLKASPLKLVEGELIEWLLV